MKISKLFHWLYAFLMFLPIFAIAGALLVSAFNMSAKEEIEINYKYQSNEVNSNEDLIEGNIYSFNYSDLDYQSIIYESNLSTIKPLTKFRVRTPVGDECYFEDDIATLPYVSIGFFEEYLFIYYDDLGNNYSSLTYYTILDDFVGILIEDNGLNYSHISYTEYNEIDSIDTHELDSQEVFYRAVEKVQTSPMFSWAYSSFLVSPFLYIMNLFSVPSNHIMVELLSYWLSVSIIWLIFDIVMYVPLLAHRWLDKGVIE